MFRLDEKISKEKAINMNPVVLAFIGDAVYSLYVREELAFNHDLKTGELNKLSSARVCAKTQADFISRIMDKLSEEELALYKRARNTKKGTKSKNSTVAEYNMSTGFEAIVGFLYVTGDEERLNYLLNL